MKDERLEKLIYEAFDKDDPERLSKIASEMKETSHEGVLESLVIESVNFLTLYAKYPEKCIGWISSQDFNPWARGGDLGDDYLFNQVRAVSSSEMKCFLEAMEEKMSKMAGTNISEIGKLLAFLIHYGPMPTLKRIDIRLDLLERALIHDEHGVLAGVVDLAVNKWDEETALRFQKTKSPNLFKDKVFMLRESKELNEASLKGKQRSKRTL